MALSNLLCAPGRASVFEGLEGRVGLSRLFGDYQRLAVYHMVPDGVRTAEPPADIASCLRDRDTRLVLVSRAPYAMLEQYHRFLGPDLPCYSDVTDVLTGTSTDCDEFWSLLPALSFFRREHDDVVSTGTFRVPGLDFRDGAHSLLEHRVRQTGTDRY